MATKQKLSHKEAIIEEWLKDNVVDYELDRNFPLANVDLESSLKNQARLRVPLNEDVVETYAEAMENGAEFPPCVGYMQGKKLIFIDGNHRGAAYSLLDVVDIPVFIVKNASTDMILKLTYEANVPHGIPNSKEDRLDHAMWLVRSGGHSQRVAATVMNVKAADLQAALSRSEADRRAAALSVKRAHWSAISISSRRRLNAIKSDAAFRKAVDVVFKMDLKTGDVSELVSAVNRERTNAAQLKVLDKYLETNKEKVQIATRSSAATRNYRHLVRSHAQSVITAVTHDDFLEGMTPQEAAEIKTLLRNLVRVSNAAIKDLAQYE